MGTGTAPSAAPRLTRLDPHPVHEALGVRVQARKRRHPRGVPFRRAHPFRPGATTAHDGTAAPATKRRRPRRGGRAYSVGSPRTTTTGQGACWVTLEETDPRTAALKPL
ncbi:hypothetical protein GCM10017667_25960 [Streptomyces filamentosus]|uniref:Uncharacterized protein n=1 Tax=Streptomyces filamentosus TaxID=67294 RepID=A0A919BJ78_STRFL|nr:hypothetical protein GCM10017667_25960 [Streptomyces filamentosus]